jgi:hypothetical protein
MIENAGMVEWQTRMSQKHLSERTCGFESRFRHPVRSHKTVGSSDNNEFMYPQATVELAKLLSGLQILDRENAEICGGLDRIGQALAQGQPSQTGSARTK